MDETAHPYGASQKPLAPALMTSLGLIGGEVLTVLEAHGATPMRRLIRELEWPAPMVLMAVGSLIREGLVRATQHDLEVILEPERTWVPEAIWRPATS